ncbi:hypothetical protein LTR36_005481 [Oleoguttula mirabilis]|uniref:Uncharacterized protein n=1 Tax=Oleoguttula mirabilis TaxID=1507867 RepID=A0AAV9JGF8_9PEZI|nr:hypothetical protein LTR36_005481 [Oleoguttula mirabilis]
MESWPIQLRQCVLSTMKSPHPRCVIWGEEQTFIYNEPAAPMFGTKHPGCLGRPLAVAFAELYEQVNALFVAAFAGQMINLYRLPLTMERGAMPEETYWDFTLLPIVGPDGWSVGVSEELMECTQIVRGERRRSFAHKFREHLRPASTMSDLWSRVLGGLEPATEDFPSVMVYAVVDDEPDSRLESTKVSSSSGNTKKCVLAGTIGVASDNVGAVQTFGLSEHLETDVGIANPCLQAWETRKAVVLSSKDGTLPASLTTANAKRGYGDELHQAVVLPITSLGNVNSELLGILVLGLNPRCPYDQEYSAWVLLLAELVEKTAVLISLPEEQRRAKQSADDTNSALVQRLRITTLQAERSDARFVRMANSAPTGMYMFDHEGTSIHVNDAYLDMIGQTREQHDTMTPATSSWDETVHPDDMHLFLGAWKSLVEQKGPVTCEYRLKRPWRSTDPSTGHEITGETWLLASAVPELDDAGEVSTVQGWLTDISHRKFSEKLLAQRLDDALEHKRQTENFIDMVSHEMRNPLSAILQSADSVIVTLDAAGMPILHEAMTLSHDAAEEIVDAAQTIILCGQHQKRIVDDILTLSKLDASLLVITPDKVQPPELVKRAMKMYESEMARADITAKLCIEPSYTELDIDWVILDSSRLLQVIINLLTNAIKFTQYSDTREITIWVGASYEKPTGKHHKVAFIPVRQSGQTPTFSAAWGTGEDLFLQIAVTDTGRGLTEDETRLLFQRFAQASPKTYKQYGGSGLGLFISRELSELQGGQIGVSSVGGKTTFTFFVKVKRFVPTTCDHPIRAPLPTAAYQLAAATDQASKPPNHAEAMVQDPGTTAQAPTPETVRKASVVEDLKGKLHVLIVEDNHINQKVMSQQLRRAGCIVHVANHGGECLSFLEKSTFCGASVPLSIILLDLEMPTMDGLTCIRHIRKRQAEGKINGHVPVIAITANARSEQISTAMEAGMDRVVTKPFRIPELVPQMQALVEETSSRTEP